jgi:copper chaperone NosL
MIRSRWTAFISLLAIALLVTGCGGEKKISLDPPDIKYNEAISEMGMFVVDPRYTAAWLPDEGEWILFDDIGEMFKYRVVRFPDTKARIIWVNDYNDREWVKAEEAWYVQTIEVNSPMGWGLAAFRDEAGAQAFQSEMGGEIMTWNEALERDWRMPPAPVPHNHASPTVDATPQP